MRRAAAAAAAAGTAAAGTAGAAEGAVRVSVFDAGGASGRGGAKEQLQFCKQRIFARQHLLPIWAAAVRWGAG